MYKPVRLDAQGRAVQLGAQGKAEQRLGGAERRLGRVGEAAELCGAAELLGVPLTHMQYLAASQATRTSRCPQPHDKAYSSLQQILQASVEIGKPIA